MRAEHIVWVGEPTNPGQWGIYPYKTKEGGELTFWMSQREHEVYLAEQEILGRLASETIHTDRNIREFLLDIERYGDARAGLAEQRVHEHNNPDF